MENKKEKLEAEFTTLQSYQSVVELLNSQYEDLASRMDPAILEAADMPMDIRSSNPTTFSDRPTVLPTSTNSPQVQAPKATPAPKQEAKVEEIKPKKKQPSCGKCRFFQICSSNNRCSRWATCRIVWF
ncbi:MAG: hypothetical protein ACLT8H_01000 [Streptococcus parasanguinis]